MDYLINIVTHGIVLALGAWAMLEYQKIAAKKRKHRNRSAGARKANATQKSAGAEVKPLNGAGQE